MSFNSTIFWHRTAEFNREMVNGALIPHNCLRHQPPKLSFPAPPALRYFVVWQLLNSPAPRSIAR